jgi:photosynthetic reaction center cytochrome c subunit
MNLAREPIPCVAALVLACLLGPALAYGQTRPTTDQAAQKPLLSEEAFKNIQVLRGIPAKEFMETMGFFAASLSLNCSDCHGEDSGSDWANYATDTPLKQTARRMVVMVTAINKANFEGTRSVTCYTCHRGNQRPKVIPSLAQQYAEPPDEDPDELEPIPGARITVTAQQILDKYIQALGGAAALTKMTSFTGKGTYEGFDSDFSEVPVDVYAKGPDLRATVVHMKGGDSTATYDGHDAWAAGPATLVPIPVVQLFGGGLLGARLDAQLTFPGQIKQILTDLRAGFPPLTIDGHAVDVIDGKMPEGVRVKLYFDKQTSLLVRQARFTDTPVGTIATHVIYSDYRPVAGVKIPFQWQVTWVDGQGTIKLTAVQANAAIDATKFAKPAPPPPPRAAAAR